MSIWHLPLVIVAMKIKIYIFLKHIVYSKGITAWNNGNRDPRGGVAEIQKRSPPTTVGDAADMQLLCYQTRESPSSGKCSIFCYRLTYISKMFSMHTEHF